MDNSLVTEEAYLQLLAQINAMSASMDQLEADTQAFIAAATSQVTQFATDEESFRIFWFAEESALVTNYLQRIKALVDGYEAQLVAHLQAYSPDATHNGALDPKVSFSITDAPQRPSMNEFFGPSCPARAAGPYLFEQIRWYGIYPGCVYSDALGGLLAEHSIRLNAPSGKTGALAAIFVPQKTPT